MVNFLHRYTSFALFFTTWNVILVILHKYTSAWFDLMYLSFITLAIGSYLSFINPRRFVFRFGDKKYTFKGLEKFLTVDMIFHIGVFCYVYYLYNTHYIIKSNDVQLFASVMLIAIYIAIVDIKRVYGINFIEIFTIFCTSHILYYTLF